MTDNRSGSDQYELLEQTTKGGDEGMKVRLFKEDWYSVLMIGEPWGDDDDSGCYDLPDELVQQYKAAVDGLDAACAAILAHIGKEIGDI